MSKNVLGNICTSAQKDSYSWALYFSKLTKEQSSHSRQIKLDLKTTSIFCSMRETY